MEEVKEVKYNQVDNDEEIDIIRNHVEQRLKQSAAQSLKEIRTNRESNVQFKNRIIKS
jgi:sensor domain CHASE-containing protein